MLGWLRRHFGLLIVLVVLVLVAGELVARYGLGLGDPPLSMAHPDIEYMFRPSQDCDRFGNTVAYNAFSMRSDGFTQHKALPDALRVMVMGDSVINGGNLTDQAELATERIKRRLSERLGRPVVVGNISAGSWGPGNLAAYAELYGLFDADVVVLVLSSHDANDVPTFEPVVGVHPGFPDERPRSALIEGAVRYLPRYLPLPGSSSPEAETRPKSAESDFAAREATVELMDAVRASGAACIVALHPERSELTEGPKPGHHHFRKLAEQRGVTIVNMAPAFRAAVDAGRRPYRDNIHPNPTGQEIITDALMPELVAASEVESLDGVRHSP